MAKRRLKHSAFLFLAALPAAALAVASPIQNANDIVNVFNKALFWISTIFWIVAVISAFYAGFLYLTAAGGEEKVKKAKRQLIYTIIAMVIGIVAAALPTLVNSFLSSS